ncbi:MAG: hypothetical protein ACRCR9_06595 [Chitinophagaceae bacterium]
MKKILFFLLICVLWSACYEQYNPKPKGYFKIDFPEKSYQLFNNPKYPYSFEYPSYATILRDTSYFNESSQNPYWINIFFPNFKAMIYISYMKIGTSSIYKIKKKGIYQDSLGTNSLKELLLKSYALAYKHTYRATHIQDSVFTFSQGRGSFFKIEGETATQYQFFVTDSSKNYLRGVLYFEATPNEDSLGVVNEFIKQDMLHLIKTIRWK